VNFKRLLKKERKMKFQKKLETMAFNFFLEEGKEPNRPLNPKKAEKLLIKASEVALTLLAIKSFSLKDNSRSQNLK